MNEVHEIEHCEEIYVIYGWLPEWPKGADCKSVVNDFDGSNPSPPIHYGDLTKHVLC